MKGRMVVISRLLSLKNLSLNGNVGYIVTKYTDNIQLL
jgi:hypothetical protein